MRVSSIPNLTGSKIMLSEIADGMVKTAFAGEGDTFQGEIASIAKEKKVDVFQLYAEILFSQRLSERYEYTTQKFEKVVAMAKNVAKASGQDVHEMLQRLLAAK